MITPFATGWLIWRKLGWIPWSLTWINSRPALTPRLLFSASVARGEHITGINSATTSGVALQRVEMTRLMRRRPSARLSLAGDRRHRWAATALGWPARDAALHALGLGFIFSMMMGHAPVILPAIARVELLFGGFFYLPLAVLQLSLVLRFVPGWGDLAWRAHGGLANALAIAVLAATLAGAALAWRTKYRAQDRAGKP